MTRPAMLGRRAVVALMAVAGCAAGLVAASEPEVALPEVLREPAVRTPRALGSATLAVTRAGARLVAVGERGVVQLSDDSGQRWRQAEAVPVQVALTAVRFVDAKTGWAAGHLGTILKTEDGGEHWVLQLDGVRAARLQADALAASGDARARAAAQQWLDEGPDKPFFDITFVDAQRGFAVGAFNLAVATKDGGKTWTSFSPRLPNPKSFHLYGLQAHGGVLFVAGEQGLLAQSSDGGATFEPIASPYKGSFFGLFGTRAGSLLAYGLRGTVYRSTDAGRQWQKVESGVPVSITAGAQLEGGAVVLLSQTGGTLISHDDGATFALQANPASVPTAGVAAAPDGSLVLASLRGVRRQPAP